MRATCAVCGVQAKARRVARETEEITWAAPAGWTTAIRGRTIKLVCKPCSESSTESRRVPKLDDAAPRTRRRPRGRD